MSDLSPKRRKELYGSRSKSQIGSPCESAEQQALFNWACYMSGKYPCLSLMYHIPNEGKRTASAGGRLKAEGLKAGVPDICLPVSNKLYHGLYIELKSQYGRASKEQKEWIEALYKQGYLAVICRGCDCAIEVILNYLKGAE